MPLGCTRRGAELRDEVAEPVGAVFGVVHDEAFVAQHREQLVHRSSAARRGRGRAWWRAAGRRGRRAPAARASADAPPASRCLAEFRRSGVPLGVWHFRHNIATGCCARTAARVLHGAMTEVAVVVGIEAVTHRTGRRCRARRRAGAPERRGAGGDRRIPCSDRAAGGRPRAALRRIDRLRRARDHVDPAGAPAAAAAVAGALRMPRRRAPRSSARSCAARCCCGSRLWRRDARACVPRSPSSTSPCSTPESPR